MADGSNEFPRFVVFTTWVIVAMWAIGKYYQHAWFVCMTFF